MADRLPVDPGSSNLWRRDWFSYEQYQIVHISYIERLAAEGVVLRDTLSFRESVDDAGEIVAVTLSGGVVCGEGVLVRIDEKLEVRRGPRNRYQVRTRFYQCHAWSRQRPGRPRKDLIRYDNAHGSGVHVHRFDGDGREVECADVAFADVPTLYAFVRDAIRLAHGAASS